MKGTGRVIEIVVLTVAMIFMGWQTLMYRINYKVRTRPYIGISHLPTTVESAGVIKTQFKIKNFGTLPAEYMNIDFSLRYGGKVVKPEKEEGVRPVSLMPGQELIVQSFKLSGQTVHDIWQKEDTLAAEITIHYGDSTIADNTPVEQLPYLCHAIWEFSSTGPKTYTWVCKQSDLD